MPSWTSPKTWTTNEILTSSDMNTYVRDNTLHVFQRVVAGTHNSTGTGSSSHTGTISFGVTFTAAPVVVGTSRDSTGGGLFVHWTSAPTTTGVAYMVTARDPADSFSSAYTVHWIAIGTQV